MALVRAFFFVAPIFAVALQVPAAEPHVFLALSGVVALQSLKRRESLLIKAKLIIFFVQIKSERQLGLGLFEALCQL